MGERFQKVEEETEENVRHLIGRSIQRHQEIGLLLFEGN